MLVGRVKACLSFKHNGKRMPSAMVEWFEMVGDRPDENTGMWVVRPETSNGERVPSIVHLYSIVRDVHLIPVFWGTQMPIDFNFSYSLDAFEHFHVNKYADYYSFECIILNTNHDVIDCS